MAVLRLDQRPKGNALLNAERAGRSELLLAEPSLESEGLRLPLQERSPGKESNPKRITRCRELSEFVQHGARSLWPLLGIVEDEEQPLRATFHVDEIAARRKKTGRP